MNKQEIRAKALEMALLNQRGGILNFVAGENNAIGLTKFWLNRLEAIEKYIIEGAYVEVSDNGCPLSIGQR